MTLVLGISAFHHDSAACLVRDDEIVAAAQEERFSRRRFDRRMPWRAIESCLAIGGVDARALDAVAFYEKPLLHFDRALATFVHSWPRARRPFVDAATAWTSERFALPSLLESELDFGGRVLWFAHHESHAASAFLASPFDEAAILTIDGTGEWTTNALGHGRGGDLELLEEIRFPHSLGMLYAAVTEYLGFEILADEYKVMGLAAYGEPRFADAIRRELVTIHEHGAYELTLPAFRFVEGEHTIHRASFERIFDGPVRGAGDPLEDRHADVAASVQSVLEEIVLAQAAHAHQRTGARNLVLAGGVALNGVVNGRLAREGPFEHVWIQPAAGDAGGAIGAALLATHRVLGVARRARGGDDAMHGALLGPEVSRDAMRHAIDASRLACTNLDDDALDAEVSRRLDRGEVVGWFQGRMEMGPRALGSRSILADARRPDAQARVNERIKFREGFRPFAPAVLEERARDYFDVRDPAPYMLVVAHVAAAQRREIPPTKGLARIGAAVSTIPGVTHVDGTARLQTIAASRHARFHRLLARFEQDTGCPLLLNTSFNLRGEPIVCTPEDAIATFLASGMDALALGSFLVTRPSEPRTARPSPPLPPRLPRAAARAGTGPRARAPRDRRARVVAARRSLERGLPAPRARSRDDRERAHAPRSLRACGREVASGGRRDRTRARLGAPRDRVLRGARPGRPRSAFLASAPHRSRLAHVGTAAG